MRKSLQSILFVFLTLIYMGTAIPVSAQPNATDEAVEKIINHFALGQQLSEIPESIRLQFEQNPLRLTPAKNDSLLAAFDASYNKDTLIRDFKRALVQQLDGEQTEALLAWLSRDETQRITDIRQLSYTLEGKRQRVITMYEMEQDPASENRMDQLHSLIDATGVVESTVESSVIILTSVIQAINEISNNQSFTEMQVNSIASNFRDQIDTQISQQYLSQMMVLFHQVDDETLRTYLDFWQSATGNALASSINESIDSSYETASQRFLESL